MMNEGGLPGGWRRARLGEVCDPAIQTWDPRTQPDRQFAYVDIASVNNVAKGIVAARPLFGRDAPSRARQVMRTSDVLVATTRPNLNAVALVPPELDGAICSTGFCVLRPLPNLHPPFLFAFVRTRQFVDVLTALTRGALYPAVTDGQVRDQRIALPALPEQRRIAAILAEQMVAVEKARAAAEAQLRAAVALPAGYVREVLAAPQARRWPRKCLGEIAGLVSKGTTPTTLGFPFVTEGVPFLRAEDVRGGAVTPSDAAMRIARETHEALSRSQLQPGDLLVTIAGTLGRFGYVPEGAPPANCNQAVAFARLRVEYAMAAYISLVAQHPEVVAPLLTLSAGGAIQNISLAHVRALRVPLPDLKEQRRVVSLHTRRVRSADRAHAAAAAQFDTLNRLPAAFLRHAFSGEL